jgi:hypothetical protein
MNGIMRKRRITIVVACLVCCAVLLVGADTPTRSTRLVLPWSKMRTLTAEQRAKIQSIHRQALDEIKQIKRQEREQILELLEQEQLAELSALEGKRTVDQKLKAAAKREAAATVPTTEESQ